MSRELVAATVAAIGPPDETAAAEARRSLDAKTKPRGSLGRLEELAVRVCGIRGTAAPGRLDAAILLVAADHGYAAEGVSAYPQEVTRQMLLNFASGGAAICVLARQAGAELVVVDAGVVEPVEHVRSVRLGPGTASAARGPAMSRDDAVAGLAAGIGLAGELAGRGVGLLALGDMGIANTTAASAICAALLPAEPAAVCGRGTGVDDEGLARKVDVVGGALAVNRPDPADPVAVLAAVGGFELAVLAGACLGAAAARVPVVLDGFIVGAAALVAVRLAPAAAGSLIAAHRSAERGHALVLEALGPEPLLDLDLRLGEGSGAALALPLVHAALAILAEMASFAEAGVTDAGR